MDRPLRILTVVCCLALLATTPGLCELRDNPRLPRYVSTVLDGHPVTVENPVDGRTWMVWAYRSGGEFDIVVKDGQITVVEYEIGNDPVVSFESVE